MADDLNLLDYFDGVFVITMDNRQDRWATFQSRARKAGVKGYSRFRAVIGDVSPPPTWWPSGNGAWGCMMSHLRVCQDALHNKLKSYLVLEDDVVFAKDFKRLLPEAMNALGKIEDSWDMLYLGGQHLYREAGPPFRIGNGLLKCSNVNRTHAMAVNGPFMQKFSQHIAHAPDYMEQNAKGFQMHIDHQLGKLHPFIKCLAVENWLFGQGGGSSNISGKQDEPEMWWPDKGWED